MLGRITGAVRFREPLSFHTSLRIGGPAEFFIMPQDLDDLRYALAFAEQEDLPLIVIGGGCPPLASRLVGAFQLLQEPSSPATT